MTGVQTCALPIYGAGLIDADALSRDLTASNGRAMPDIRREFGEHSVDASGALDRAYMRDLIFKDATAKNLLESILHPLVAQASLERSEALTGQGINCLLYDVPLLVESKRWRASVDQVLVVDCETSTQTQRVMARSKLTQAEVESIMAHQVSRLQRLSAADLVLYNDRIEIASLEAEVAVLAQYFGLSSRL